jgi:hypothetical protein
VQYNLRSITSDNSGDGWLSLICNRINYSLFLPELLLLSVFFSAMIERRLSYKLKKPQLRLIPV